MQTTAFCLRSRSYCSPHSVEPVSVYSSASHSPITIVRRGPQALGGEPAERPPEGEHRGRSRRGIDAAVDPGVVVVGEQDLALGLVGARSVAMTFRIVRFSRVFSIFRWSRTGPGPTRYVSASRRVPARPSPGTAGPAEAARGSRPRRGTRAASSGSSAGSRTRPPGCGARSAVEAQPGVSGSPGTMKS